MVRTFLASCCCAAIALAGAGTASAGLEQRAGDPVVVSGEDVPRLIGVSPSKIVAFAWKGGWQQIPVQVDERKTVSVRDLYPTPAPAYVRAPDLTFELEVYADSETRSGADPDALLDGNDEIALMSQDAGARVRSGKVAGPAGTSARKATMVEVKDPVDGAAAWVYLFEANGSPDQSAGRSYVDYDFNPLYLEPGQSLKDGYRYSNSANPEDTTVTTDYYSTHSTDRWMDDEIRVRAGGASGVDILDREVAQATRTSCGRSELTFSGNWTNRGSDNDEGTFVAVRSGPIRTIRDYMGANSGPYTQRQHIYYERREDTTTFLRVHPMLDLYTWTDYSPAAVGMTYRNQSNPGGVPVDGSPDVLDQPDSADFQDGKVFWEQLAGTQGSVSTVASVETTIPNPSFGSYYLDDSNAPLTGDRRQCAGDGLSYGASGFGILGPVTPNTDPRLPQASSLTLKRVRYFGSPSDAAAEAAALADRVRLPLTVSSSAFTTKKSVRLKLHIEPLTVVFGPRRQVKVPIRVTNKGDRNARVLRVCLRAKKVVRGGCRSVAKLKAGRTISVKIRLTIPKKRWSRPATVVRLVGTATAKGSKKAKKRALLSLLSDPGR